MQKINPTVMQIKNLAIDGNIIDNGWIEKLRFESGKPNTSAILILSEIYYWYKPTLIRDEVTGKAKGYKQKFKADKLQKSYQALGDRFGISKRQAKLACDFLKEKGLITIEFRTIEANGKRLNNVMFIEPVASELKRITGIDRMIDKNDPVTTGCNRVLQQNVGGSYNEMYHPPTTECKTNTKTTTETTTYINKNISEDDHKDHAKELFDYWNSLIQGIGLMKKGKQYTPDINKIISARLNDHSLQNLKKMLARLSKNSYYLGDNDNKIVYFCKHKTVFNKSKCADRIENLELIPINRKIQSTNQGRNGFNSFSQSSIKYNNGSFNNKLRVNKFNEGANRISQQYSNEELEKRLGIRK